MGLQQIPHVPFSSAGAHAPRTIGHAHFWDRAMSRRSMLMGTAAAAGVMVGGRILSPRFGTVAGAASTAAEPRPIPGGFMALDERRYHAYVPGRVDPLDPSSPINDPSTITDFGRCRRHLPDGGRGNVCGPQCRDAGDLRLRPAVHGRPLRRERRCDPPGLLRVLVTRHPCEPGRLRFRQHRCRGPYRRRPDPRLQPRHQGGRPLLDPRCPPRGCGLRP